MSSSCPAIRLRTSPPRCHVSLTPESRACSDGRRSRSLVFEPDHHLHIVGFILQRHEHSPVNRFRLLENSPPSRAEDSQPRLHFESADHPQAQPQGRGLRQPIEGAVPVAVNHIDPPDLHPMPLLVLHN